MRTLFALYVLLTPKVPKVALIATQRPHATRYAARYPPQRAAKACTVANTTVCLWQPTFDASRILLFVGSAPKPLEISLKLISCFYIFDNIFDIASVETVFCHFFFNIAYAVNNC